MSMTSRTAFSLLGQLEDEEDVQDAVADLQLQPQKQEVPAPRMPPRPMRPVAPLRPRPPPNVDDRLTLEDRKYTVMCKEWSATGTCSHASKGKICFYAHSVEQQRAARQRLARRVAEERAKLGWVPPSELQQRRHLQYLAADGGAHPGPGGDSGSSSGLPIYSKQKYKTQICRHWVRDNGHCSFGDACHFAHGERELRQHVQNKAEVQAELARRGLRSQAPLAAAPMTVATQDGAWPVQLPQLQQHAVPPGYGTNGSSLLSPPPAPPPPAAAAPAVAGGMGAVSMSSAQLAEYLSTAAQLDEGEEDAPDAFYCPVTHVLFDDPVVAADGHTYERHAIEAWLAKEGTSPMTGEALKDKRLLPNHTLVAAMRAMLGEHVCAGRRQ